MQTIDKTRTFLLAATMSMFAAGAFAQSGQVDTSTMTPRELYQYAEALRTGEAVAVDLETALTLHTQLAQGGETRSYERMAIILLELGLPEEAIQALQMGSLAGELRAQRALAMGHMRNAFGDASDPVAGVAILETYTQQADDQGALYTLANAYAEGTGTAKQPEAAIAIYNRLADQNYGRALQQLGDFARDGAFGAANPELAADYYRRAIENDHSSAWFSLARLLQEEGDYQGAIDAFQESINTGYGRAYALYAESHFLGEFGDLSDRALGARLLETGAESGEVDAAATALQLWERRSRRIQSLDLEGVLDMLDGKMREGDRTATAALARAYRQLQWRIPNARARHAELVQNYGDQLGRMYFTEFMHSIYDRSQHRQSWQEAYDIVQPLGEDDFVTAAYALRSTEQTAFVYMLQRELIDLGYMSGAANGRFDTRTLRATKVFCEAEGIDDLCVHGPLTRPASIAIIEALAATRG